MTVAHAPDLVVWELTTTCNLRCIHCGSSAGQPRPDELTTTEACTLIKDIADLGSKGITLMGGEVFLRNDWDTIATTIKDRGLSLSLVTNGAVDPAVIFPRLRKLHVDCLMVGLDAATPSLHDTIRGVPGAFETTLGFIRAARNQGFSVGIITTVHKMNFTQLPLLLHLVENEEVYWQIQEAVPIGRCAKDLLLSPEEYYAVGLFISAHQRTQRILGAHNFGFHSTRLPTCDPYPPWHGCHAGVTVLGITSTGNVKGCLALPDSYIIGNIRSTPIHTLLESARMPSRHPYEPDLLGPNCRSCPHAPDCNGGCTTRSVSMTGIPHNDPHCFYRIEEEDSP